MLSSLSPVLTALAAMAAVLSLIWLAQRAARWSGIARRPSGTQLLALEDALALDSRRRLLVVRCGDRRCVLMTGGTQDLVVGWLP
jgi:flagellar protein FliO/FliZ